MISKNASIAIGLILILFVGVAVGLRIRFELEAVSLASSICAPLQWSPEIYARAAYLVDIQTGDVLYQKEATQQVPLASLTKLMTTLVAHEILGGNSRITISDASFEPEGDSGFLLNEMWDSSDLIDFTLITSSNDGAHTLALETSKKLGKAPGDFYMLMNEKAQELKLSQTYFLNETGLDVSSSTSGAYGSAKDVASLLMYANHTVPETFSASSEPKKVFTSLSGFEHVATHTSAVTSEIPGGVLAKTGFTDLAGGNLAIIAEPIPGRPVAIAVLQSDRDIRNHDVKVLYDYAKKIIKHQIACTNL